MIREAAFGALLVIAPAATANDIPAGYIGPAASQLGGAIRDCQSEAVPGESPDPLC